jgi:hypothetical protein
MNILQRDLFADCDRSAHGESARMLCGFWGYPLYKVADWLWSELALRSKCAPWPMLGRGL